MCRMKATTLLVCIISSYMCHHCIAEKMCGNEPSAVALVGTNVNISCWCTGGSSNLVFNDAFFYGVTQEDLQEMLVEWGITVTPYTMDAFSGFHVQAIASEDNNGTFFDCSTGSSSGNISSPNVYIYAVFGPPSPPSPPSLSALDSTTLDISWTAPWSLPVDNYTITMRNNASLEIQSYWTTTQTSSTVTKPQNSDCVLFDFTVEACTGGGPTGPSQPSTAGFPSSPEAYEIEFSRLDAFATNDLVTININIKVSKICSYEIIRCKTNILNVNNSKDSSMDRNISSSDPELVLNFEQFDASPGDVIEVVFMVFDIDSQEFQTYASSVIILELLPTTSSSTANSVSPLDSVSPLVEEDEPENDANSILLFVASVAGGIIGIMLCVIAFTVLGMLVVFCHKSAHKKRRRMSLEGSDKMEVTIPPLKSNPLYDVNPNELYDEIPTNKTILTSLLSPTSKSNDRYNNQFFCPSHSNQPELPPRKSAIPLHETKISPKATTVCDNDSDKEDYVEMSAIGPDGTSSLPRSPLTPNQPHNAPSRNSMYSSINNAPPTMPKFQHHYRLNMEDENSSHYSHLQTATIV